MSAASVPVQLIYPDAESNVPGNLWTYAPDSLESDTCPVCCEAVTVGPCVSVDSAPMMREVCHLHCIMASAAFGTLVMVVGEAELPDTGRHHERVA